MDTARLRSLGLKATAATLAMVGRASATTISIPTIDGNLSSLFAFIVGIINELPGVVFALIGVIVGIIAILIITKTGHFVTKLYDKIINAIQLR